MDLRCTGFIQRQRRATLQVFTVEKRLYRINPNTFELDEITADDATYKVGLFLDKDGTIPYGDDYIRTDPYPECTSQAKLLTVMFLEVPIMYSSFDENNKAIQAE